MACRSDPVNTACGLATVGKNLLEATRKDIRKINRFTQQIETPDFVVDPIKDEIITLNASISPNHVPRY